MLWATLRSILALQVIRWVNRGGPCVARSKWSTHTCRVHLDILFLCLFSEWAAISSRAEGDQLTICGIAVISMCKWDAWTFRKRTKVAIVWNFFIDGFTGMPFSTLIGGVIGPVHWWLLSCSKNMSTAYYVFSGMLACMVSIQCIILFCRSNAVYAAVINQSNRNMHIESTNSHLF